MKKVNKKLEDREEPISKVNYQSEQLPTNFAEEVDLFIDYSIDHDTDSTEIPQWQQNLVLQRIQDNLPMEDAWTQIPN